MTHPVGDFAMDIPNAENPGTKPIRLAQQSAMTTDLPSTRSTVCWLVMTYAVSKGHIWDMGVGENGYTSTVATLRGTMIHNDD